MKRKRYHPLHARSKHPEHWTYYSPDPYSGYVSFPQIPHEYPCWSCGYEADSLCYHVEPPQRKRILESGLYTWKSDSKLNTALTRVLRRTRLRQAVETAASSSAATTPLPQQSPTIRSRTSLYSSTDAAVVGSMVRLRESLHLDPLTMRLLTPADIVQLRKLFFRRPAPDSCGTPAETVDASPDEDAPRPLSFRTIAAIQAEAIRAARKHGWSNTPASPTQTDHERLVILAEEFGEVARAMTYDEGDPEHLADELIQTATMAAMWVDGLRASA